MDIKGAKALKERLSLNGAKEAPPAPVDVDVPEDAPPVFRWVGVSHAAPRDAADIGSPGEGVSLFRRLGLSFR
jgi:hypothetical protein